MSIIESLVEKYPTSSVLIIPTLKANLEFIFGDGVSGEFKAEFLESIHNLGIGITKINTIYEPVQITVNISNEIPELTVGDRYVFRFPDKEPVDAMAWTAYSLASKNTWLPSNGRYDVIFGAYNAKSQKIAASVLNDVETKLKTVPETESTIEDAARKYSRRFCEEKPVFSNRIVSESGANLIFSGKHILAKRQEVRLRNLAESLYGRENFADEIREYCDFIRAGSEYRECVEEAVQYCLEKLPTFLIFKLASSIETARQSILSGFKPKEWIENAETELNRKREYIRLTPKTISGLFENVDKYYALAAEEMVCIAFLNDFTEILMRRIKENLKDALTDIQIDIADIKNFCIVTPNDYGAVASWSEDWKLKIINEDAVNQFWDAESISSAMINTVLPSGFFTKVWFAEKDIVAKAIAEGVQDIQPVDSLDCSMLCVLGFKADGVEVV